MKTCESSENKAQKKRKKLNTKKKTEKDIIKLKKILIH